MEKFKEALQNCDTVKVILTGVGETEFSTKELYESIQELERLAEIGKAVETAALEGSPWIIDTCSGIDTWPNEEDIKTLISWYRGESGEE